MKNFKNLKVWQNGIELVVNIYKKTETFSKEEIYGLTGQLKRSAVSIPSNIAEGSGQNTDKDFNRFLDVDLGSSFELETQLIIANKLNFLDKENFNQLNKQLMKNKK